MMRKNQGLTATALLGPATIFIAVGLLAPLAILLRYSLNEFVAQTKTMVDALTIQNYITFFTDAYYTGALLTTVRIALYLWSRGDQMRSRAPRPAVTTRLRKPRLVVSRVPPIQRQ